ncbi:hypothetical protein GobsT_55430 [Gemmata obscuriglobus]|uniref:DoxX family protein n=1 Tax=Gemmata obscuriglobus TaxID=114 RepID=A0A2Z3GS95_9BACT|nr:DoxX family protein [Gemmata obscuriglobus]AWM36633.1 hypothetical protein C1280_06075 [Gemmata obscuriglobus]QEG30731.1 hypothetical protein GobsT_55430 [Gemmata obscuriglobus]VTS10061.1 : DoxX_2 [Gemmata obscuriglobus UQM 2246]
MMFIESAFQPDLRYRRGPVAVWGTGLLVGLLFVVAGLTKLLPGVRPQFDQWGIPAWVRLLVGAAEFVGGVLFCLPRAGAAGAGLLGVLLASGVGAYFVLRPDELPFPLVPVMLFALVALVTWGRARLAWWCRYAAALDRFTAREVGKSGPGRRR